MKRMLILLFLLPLALFCVKVDVSVNKYKLSTNDFLELTLRITDSNRLNVSEPQAPVVKLFSFRNMTSGSSSSVVMSGLKMITDYAQTYKFTYVANTTGSTIIPAFSVRVNNQNYSTKPIQIEVVKAANPNSTPSNSPAFPRDPFGLFDSESEAYRGRSTGNTRLLALPETQYVYRGFPAVVSYYLYTDEMVRSFNLEEEKDFSGYGKATFEQPTMLNYEDVRLDGKIYKRALIKKLSIMPNSEGELIAPQLSGVARLYNIGYLNKNLQSSGGRIIVRPLPKDNVPDGFSGAVGNFSVSYSISDKEVSLGEALTFTLKIQGRGNFNQFSAPSFAEGKGFQISSGVVMDNLNAGMDGNRTYYYTLIPQNKGELELPALSFVWFANDLGSYKTFTVPKQKVLVKSAHVLSYLNRLWEPRQPGAMLPRINRKEYPVYHAYTAQVWYWISIILILAVTAVFTGIALDKKLKLRDPEKYAEKQAEKILGKYLKPAITAAGNNSGDFYPLAEKALINYLSSKYQLSNRLSTQEKLDALSQKQIPVELVKNLQKFLANSLAVRYAPENERAGNLQDDLILLKSIVAEFSQTGDNKLKRWL
ncbi:MAG: BatD family protein [Candidatus Cloacimonetes bacterium]|nr:BatD family protein [Candidatus Cloacimonadota bacterium]